ncbi:MAG: hypothetical protein BGP03_05875 [Pseudonocardia sp. 73-21]|nr:MAG: hypothetical protein BGP03_05875 [Pseudonocardia sp. 73-21]
MESRSIIWSSSALVIPVSAGPDSSSGSCGRAGFGDRLADRVRVDLEDLRQDVLGADLPEVAIVIRTRSASASG